MDSTTMSANAIEMEEAGIPARYRFPWSTFLITCLIIILVAFSLNVRGENKALVAAQKESTVVQERLSAQVRVLETRVGQLNELNRAAHERAGLLASELESSRKAQAATVGKSTPPTPSRRSPKQRRR